jgi:hypothetical protein
VTVFCQYLILITPICFVISPIQFCDFTDPFF